MERIIADVVDYAIARQIIDVPFCESLGDSRFTDSRIRYVDDQGPITPRDLAKHLGISGAAITSWSKRWLDKEVLTWVDDQGAVIKNKNELKKIKHSGKAYLKVVGVNRLPTPFEITGDQAWDVGGELYQLYDLELDIDDDLLSGDFECEDGLNTIDDSEEVENSQENDAPRVGVQESTKKQSMGNFDPDDPETMKLYEEIGAVLKP